MLMGQGNKYRLFRLFGFPVYVQSSILILLVFYLLLGSGGGAPGILSALLFAVVAFASILVHELGHAFMIRRLGLGESSIILHGLGGLTQWRSMPDRRQRILVSLAGPAAGLLLGCITLVFYLLFGLPDEFLLRVLVVGLLWINLGWSLVNLLPVWPLDGGQVLRTALDNRRRSQVEAAVSSLKVSMATAGVVVVAALAFRYLFVAVLFGLILWSNYNEYKQINNPPESFYGY
ncbi:MAG: site-2 protease family protein [Bradymonadales bacterium]|nr:site-2 protease family protein [Bradymonadales bacterium]